jgi:hypothetical protein
MVNAGCVDMPKLEREPLALRPTPMPVTTSRVLAAGLMWLSAACAHVEPSPAATQPTAAVKPPPAKALKVPPAPQPAESIESFMAEHAVITTWARDAVVAGDLDQLREPLGALAAYHYDTVKLGAWLPFMAELQQTASLTARAKTLELAAAGVATMGRICGDCHTATGGGPHSFVPHEPTLETSQPWVAGMQAHGWAADELWQGLTTPSDAAWNAGASALSHMPTMSGAMPASYARALLDVQNLGVSAQGLTAPGPRADLYGVLIATCAACHVDTIDHAP